MKERVWVSLSEPVAKRLERAAEDAHVLKSEIVEEALKAFFDPKPEAMSQTLLLRRLDQMSRTLGTMGRDLAIVTETLGLYVRYVLTVTPPLAKAEQEAAQQLGRERFERFVAQVGRRLGSDRRLIAQVLETIAAEKPELFGEAIAEAEAEGDSARVDETGESSEAR
jgi:hypothetical protein